MKRQQLMVKYVKSTQSSPLAILPNGLYKITNPDLNREMHQYFLDRREDGVVFPAPKVRQPDLKRALDTLEQNILSPADVKRSRLQALQLTVLQRLKGAFTPEELRAASLSASDIASLVGFTLDEFRKAGYTATELHEAGFRVAALLKGGFTKAMLLANMPLAPKSSKTITLHRPLSEAGKNK